MAFNSKEYSWAEVQVVMLGRPVTRIRGIKYGVKKEKEYLHARGENPHSIQSGNKTYEGEITLLQSELEAMQAQLSSTEDLTDMDAFSITVAYVPKNNAQVVVHILKAVEFTEDMREMQQGDKFQEIALPIMFLERDSA